MRDQISNSCPFLCWKVELHVRSMLLESVKELLLGGAHDVMNFMNLVKFIVTWKERDES